MIQAFGELRPWGYDVVFNVITARILKGAELTVCKDGTCWINRWRKGEQEIHPFLADMYIVSGLVGVDSGNLETGDVHYTYYMSKVYDALNPQPLPESPNP